MKLVCAAAIALTLPLTLSAQQAAPPARGPHRIMAQPIDFNDHTGFTQLFDGKTLNGWDGDPKVWSVADGAIVGEYKTPGEGPHKPESFLILKDKNLSDFELRLEIKLEGGDADSGIQYRSFVPTTGTEEQKRWHLGGYQFDFNFINTYTGQVAEELGRGIIASRGEVVRTRTGEPPLLYGSTGSMEELGGYFHQNGWNQIVLIAKGHEFIHIVNGHVTGILIDDDAAKFRASGLLGLQCAGRGPLKISFRNIWVREIHGNE